MGTEILCLRNERRLLCFCEARSLLSELKNSITCIDGRVGTIPGSQEVAAPSVCVDDGAQLQGKFEITGKRAALPLAS